MGRAGRCAENFNKITANKKGIRIGYLEIDGYFVQLGNQNQY